MENSEYPRNTPEFEIAPSERRISVRNRRGAMDVGLSFGGEEGLSGLLPSGFPAEPPRCRGNPPAS